VSPDIGNIEVVEIGFKLKLLSGSASDIDAPDMLFFRYWKVLLQITC